MNRLDVQTQTTQTLKKIFSLIDKMDEVKLAEQNTKFPEEQDVSDG